MCPHIRGNTSCASALKARSVSSATVAREKRTMMLYLKVQEKSGGREVYWRLENYLSSVSKRLANHCILAGASSPKKFHVSSRINRVYV